MVPGDLSAGHRAAVEAEHPALQPPPLYSLEPDRGEAGAGKTTSTSCTCAGAGLGLPRRCAAFDEHLEHWVGYL